VTRSYRRFGFERIAGRRRPMYRARSKHRQMRFAILISTLLASTLCSVSAATIDYGRDVLPILSDKCYHCHGPDEKARKAKLRLDLKESALRTNDPVIIPGNLRDSELVKRITTTNADDQMPPPDSNRSLTSQQIQTLKQWVEQGARWGAHWAFVAPRRPEVPKKPVLSAQLSVKGGTRPSAELSTDHWALSANSIDAFVLARLEKEGLSPAPEAKRETWLRRVTLDLTGLPPTLPEIDAFLADASANAYEKVVDRLLASPRFGERMASEWLDLSRFADTHGYQMDRFRPVWPYRDWVIKAFNQNLSFDQFVTWQLAGDLLPNATKEQRLATAFNRLHNQNEEGGVVEEEYRVAYVVDRVNTFGTAFLGLTTECARCHDHKYDPITQRDFYSLFAFFQNIDESGQTSYFTDSMPVPTLLLSTDEQDKKLAELRQSIAALEEELKMLRSETRRVFDAWLQAPNRTTNPFAGLISSPSTTKPGQVLDSPPPKDVPGLIAHYSFDEIVSNKVANLVSTNFAKAHEGPKLIDGRFGSAVELSGENGFTFGKVGHFNRADPFTFSLWLQTPSHAPRSVVLHHSKAPIDAGSRGYELLLENGRVAFGLHHMWPGNSLKVASKTRLATNQWTHLAVTYDGSSRARGLRVFINGLADELDVIRDGLWKDITYGGDEPELALGYRFRDNGFKGGRVDELKIFNRVLTAIEVADAATKVSLTNLLATATDQLTQDQRAQLFDFFFNTTCPPVQRTMKDLQKARDEQRKLINPIPEIMAMQELPQPKPAQVLKRGAYDAPGENVPAKTPSWLLPFPANQPTNRLGLAKWLLQPEHPLMARVTVNRFWQMMFGRGLVETSDNFGSQGAQPVNQELLDWLALEFSQPGGMAAGHPWDVKRLLKLVALSATYRQSSHDSTDSLTRDPQNDFLARGPSQKLSAEMLRDQSLALSGLLVDKIGGPSVKPYQPEGVWEIAMGKPHYDQGRGDDLHRRSLYTYWKRTVPPPTMMAFDAADRSYCTARRQNTSTPLQALALLNDVQVVEAARLMSQRMLKEGGAGADERIAWMFRAVSNRKPTTRELAVLKQLFEEQRAIFAADGSAAEKFLKVGEAKNDGALDPVDLAAGTVLAEALLSHDEAVMRR
jgi:hypothetical protein